MPSIEQPIFLRQGAQSASTIANSLKEFADRAKKTLHIAIYDFRITGNEKATVVGALRDAAARGVEVQIAYDHTKANGTTKTDKTLVGDDPAPRGTDAWVREAFPEASAVKLRAISGSHLMHDKYIIRDGATRDAAVWTGSANFTDDAWTKQENNIVVVSSPDLASFYEQDFDELWSNADIAGTGVDDFGTVNVGDSVVDVAFSPGEGHTIEEHFVRTINRAGGGDVALASMVLSSGPILGALVDHLNG